MLQHLENKHTECDIHGEWHEIASQIMFTIRLRTTDKDYDIQMNMVKLVKVLLLCLYLVVMRVNCFVPCFPRLLLFYSLSGFFFISYHGRQRPMLTQFDDEYNTQQQTKNWIFIVAMETSCYAEWRQSWRRCHTRIFDTHTLSHHNSHRIRRLFSFSGKPKNSYVEWAGSNQELLTPNIRFLVAVLVSTQLNWRIVKVSPNNFENMDRQTESRKIPSMRHVWCSPCHFNYDVPYTFNSGN